MGERPDGARELADADRLASAREAVEVPLHLGVPEGQLQAERHGLCVDAVGASDHDRARVLERAPLDRLHQAAHPLEQKVGRLDELQRERRVDDVARGEAEVDEARVGADAAPDRAQEGDDVVADLRFDPANLADVEAGAAPDRREGARRDLAARGEDLANRELDAEPEREAILVGPDPTHLRPCVAWDHAVLLEQDAGSASQSFQVTSRARLDEIQTPSSRRIRPRGQSRKGVTA